MNRDHWQWDGILVINLLFLLGIGVFNEISHMHSHWSSQVIVILSGLSLLYLFQKKRKYVENQPKVEILPQDYYNFLCNTTSELIVISDLKGNIVKANESFIKEFKIQNSDNKSLIALNLFNYLIVDDSNQFINKWENTLENKAVEWGCKFINNPDSIHHYLFNSVSDLENKLVYSIGRDVSALRNYESRILSASKMISLSQISAGIAHEINNPLTIIRGRVELIKRQLSKEVPDINKIRSYLENTDEMVTRAASIIDALRIFTLSSSSTEINSNSFEEAWALPLIEKSITLFKERLGKRKIKVEINLKGDDFKVYCRTKEIIHVINILMANSIDAIQKLPDPWIKCEIEKVDSQIVITFIDSGRGIQVIDTEKIMEPFYSTKAQRAGLGLSIAKGLVSGHGGTLEYDAARPHTTFLIKFPHSKKETGIEITRNAS